MNLPEDNMNSIAELRMNALTLKVAFRVTVELMKIGFSLITFYQCFVKEGLPCFTVFRAKEKEMIRGFNVAPTNTNWIYCLKGQ